jgi:hypothetical protein
MSAASLLGCCCFAGTRIVVDGEWLGNTEGGNVPFTPMALMDEIDAALAMVVYTPPTVLSFWECLLETLAISANGLATAGAMVVSPLKTRNLMQVVLATGIVTCMVGQVFATMRKK